MINLICKISPELHKSSAKIGAILAFNEKYLAFITDSITIEIVEYNKHDRKVLSTAVSLIII